MRSIILPRLALIRFKEAHSVCFVDGAVSFGITAGGITCATVMAMVSINRRAPTMMPTAWKQPDAEGYPSKRNSTFRKRRGEPVGISRMGHGKRGGERGGSCTMPGFPCRVLLFKDSVTKWQLLLSGS